MKFKVGDIIILHDDEDMDGFIAEVIHDPSKYFSGRYSMYLFDRKKVNGKPSTSSNAYYLRYCIGDNMTHCNRTMKPDDITKYIEIYFKPTSIQNNIHRERLSVVLKNLGRTNGRNKPLTNYL